MRKTMLYLCLLLFSMAAQAQQCGMDKCKPQCRKTPVKMILDAEFGSSTDDLFALMMLNHYIDEGRVSLNREFGKEFGVYFSILSAIASGKTSFAEIYNIVGKDMGGQLTKLETYYAFIAKTCPAYE